MARMKIHFPTVWKSTEQQSVAIVYWDRVEYYGGKNVPPEERARRIYRGTKDHKFDPFSEEDMLKGGGFKRVHEPKALVKCHGSSCN